MTALESHMAVTCFPRVGGNRTPSKGPNRSLRIVLGTITPLITSAHDHGFLQGLVPALAGLFHAQRVSIMLLERPGDIRSSLRLEASAGLPANATRRKSHAGGVAEQVLQMGTPALIVSDEGLSQTPFEDRTSRWKRGSSICAPIATPMGCLFGVINVGRRGASTPLTGADLEVCDAIAMLVGDTLERLQSQEAERVLRERMRAVEHLSMLGEVAAGIAHEIANPLATVQSNVTSLASYIQELAPLLLTAQDELATVASDLPVLLHDVQEGIDRVEEIIRNMKSMLRANHDSGRVEIVDVEEVVVGTLRLLRPRLHGRLSVSVDPSLFAMGRAIDVTQILVNLIVNADDACEERLHTDPDRTNDPIEIQIRAGAADEEVWIEVTDNGGGISGDNLERVFQPLFTTKVGRGTGLGLSICHRLAESLNGRLQVQSTVGKGTTFRLTLRRWMGANA